MITKITTSDEWETPQWLFDELDKEFNFDIDLCATADNKKCFIFYDDYLQDNIRLSTLENAKKPFSDLYDKKNINCFMNPPYSNPLPFVQKAWEDSKHCKIVCLLRVDPSTKWWSVFWDYEKCSLCTERTTKIPEYAREDFFCRFCFNTKIYRGPKLGCEVRFLPKRVSFINPKSCGLCVEDDEDNTIEKGNANCPECRGTGKAKSTGNTHASCIVIMDRRNL